MKTLTTLLALAAAPTLLAPAAAQNPAFESRTQIVRFADLDFDRADGQRELDRRIRVAIDQACGPASPADPTSGRAVHACRLTLEREVAAQRTALLGQPGRGATIVVALRR